MLVKEIMSSIERQKINVTHRPLEQLWQENEERQEQDHSTDEPKDGLRSACHEYPERGRKHSGEHRGYRLSRLIRSFRVLSQFVTD